MLRFTSDLHTIYAAKNNNKPTSYNPQDIETTGYPQTQFQKALFLEISSLSRSDFLYHSDNSFMLRRGSLKIDRMGKYPSIIFKLDATEDDVQLKYDTGFGTIIFKTEYVDTQPDFATAGPDKLSKVYTE